MPGHIGRTGKRRALMRSPTHQSYLEQGDGFNVSLSLAAITISHPSYSSEQATTSPFIDLKSPPLAKYSLGKGDKFPTERRPQLRDLTSAPSDVIEAWFQASGITIGSIANTPDRLAQAKRLFYTWKEFFATSVREVKPTDLIEHSIDLTDDARPVKAKLPRYTGEERAFANQIFPDLEDAGIITRRSSPWGARTKFPPKKKGSELLRVVHNFIPLNRFTIKSAYPMHRLEEVLNILIRPQYKVHFSTDAANGYWAIPMKYSDINKTGIITPSGQWVYLRMGQGLKGGPHTYAQFSDLVFGPLPANSTGIPRQPTLIGNDDSIGFAVFMDDHAASAEDYDSLFSFLHEKYFPRVAFGPVYLVGSKTKAFSDILEIVGFEGGPNGLRPSLKHRERIRNTEIPQNRAELDAFLWLTPFLRIFIPGRAEHVLKLKEAYLKLVPATPKVKPPHDDDMEECDKDFTKIPKKSRPPKKTIQRVYVEKEFDFGLEQGKSFQAIKDAIADNAMTGPDPAIQYHLVTDASQRALGGVLFQLHGVPPSTEASPKFQNHERIILFLSFKLNDAETRYGNSERECLAVIRCLTEVRWMIMGSPWPIMIYSDHEALKAIFRTGETEKGRIATWMDRLGEYDFQLMHRPSRDQHIGVADGLSRMPTRYSTTPTAEIGERLAMAAISHPRVIFEDFPDRLAKYRESLWYQDIVNILQQGPDALSKLPRNRRRHIIFQSKRYRLPEIHETAVLRYKEITGVESICMLEEEVPKMLRASHEDHGHYSAQLTMDFLIGRAYWPTRVSDVHDWCKSCHACQITKKKPIRAEVQFIQSFEPMKMLGMDWVGPISPACNITGARYVLLMVCYFTRFTWAKAYTHHTAVEVVDMMENHVAPVFGYPAGVYTDNGSHFVNQEVSRLFQRRGVTHFTGPVSHPSSTGLLERAVQGLVGYLRTKCIERGTQDGWSLLVREATLATNTKDVKIHGYSPAELLLGFEPKLTHFDTDLVPIEDPGPHPPDLPRHQLQLYMALRDENKCLSSEAASYRHGAEKLRKRRQRIPKPGDLVIIRHHTIDNQKGRKLESKWLGPRLLIRFSASGLSAYVRELHGSATEKKYHINDILLYYPRQPVVIAGTTLIQGPRGTTPVVQGGRIGGGGCDWTGAPGSRAVILAAHRS